MLAYGAGCNDSPHAPVVAPCVDSDSSHLSRIEQPTEVNIGFVGDLMMHRWQMEKAYDPETGLFDFSGIFTLVEPYFAEADYLVGNLETTFAGYGNGRNSDVFGYSCFPHFNSPDEYAIQMKRSGFDMLTFANNHTYDSRFSGVKRTLNLLDSLGIDHTGAYRTAEEASMPKIVEIKGIRVGVCAYTFSLNGIHVPDSLKFAVNEFIDYDHAKLDKMKQDIRRLKQEGADFVFAVVHFGNEYQLRANNDQRVVSDALIAAGADAIMGSHPHVVQSLEIKTTSKGGSMRNVPVFYSLGNFLSSQRQTNNVPKDVGLYAKIKLVKWMGKTRVKRIDCIPTYVYWTRRNIGVIPVLRAKTNPSEYSFLTKEDTARINATANSIETTLFDDKTPHHNLPDRCVMTFKPIQDRH